MNEHKHAEILRAIADGKAVQFRKDKNDVWSRPSKVNPLADPYLEWRTKPTNKQRK